jgi:hypothetical protein
MREKHSMCRRPDTEIDPNPLGGLLLSEHLRHNFIHDLYLSGIQSHGSSCPTKIWEIPPSGLQ